MKPTLKLWKNRASFFHIGRPRDLSEDDIPESFCPTVAPGGKGLWIGPQNIWHDDRGTISMVMNNAHAFVAFAQEKWSAIKADCQKLDINPNNLEFLGGRPTVLEDSTVVAVRIKGAIPKFMADVTSQHAEVLNQTANRIESAKVISDALRERDEMRKKLEAAEAEVAVLRARHSKTEEAPLTTEQLTGKRSQFPKSKE